MDNPFESPVVLSFCPGILGIERGLARSGVHCRVAAYVEIEAFVIANLVAGMEAGILDSAPIWTDAKTFDARPFRGRIHGIIGGYPCKPFSVIGKQNGDEHEQHIWPNIYNTADIVRPKFLFFENVFNHLHIGYQAVKQDLEGLGYAVKEGIYSANEIGAPHKRERLFILALDHSFSEGLQRYARYVNSTGGRFFRESGSISKAGIFPCPRGTNQQHWEKPRIIKSGMGCTTHGYNFREDILRALGNSVVEQTAELAFNDLLKKHLIYK